MKILIDSLIMSMHDILKVVFLTLLVWLIFAIFGISLFKDQLGYCEFPTNFNIGKLQCSELGLRWTNYYHNFDNIFEAM